LVCSRRGSKINKNMNSVKKWSLCIDDLKTENAVLEYLLETAGSISITSAAEAVKELIEIGDIVYLQGDDGLTERVEGYKKFE
jgi:hypothetical protein